MSDREHQITYELLEEVQGWPDNPKAHDIYKLKLSYKHHGFVTPVVMDEGTGRLVAGHGRLQALKELRDEGADLPTGIKLSPQGEWMLPVVRGITFPSEEAARAYVIADNQLTIAGGWDAGKMTETLRQIEASGFIEAAGMDMDTFEDMFAEMGSVPEVVPDKPFEGSYAETPHEQAERESGIQSYTPHREVVMLFLDDEHEVFARNVNTLKKLWGIETLKGVISRAVAECLPEGSIAASEPASKAPEPEVGAAVPEESPALAETATD